ncbi:Protein RER1 [Babesia sp. Xinjiang]|uniref:Protein RER1 n=1 Tax=Babesia sp. Xinjiang TaxID=462227 RepID=UPI000A22E4FF|nr:Protein RER1 [Babesia sp. Xinjiang]ORM42211.1 Protein RER1 [Babesia sp. Xinjiang]
MQQPNIIGKGFGYFVRTRQVILDWLSSRIFIRWIYWAVVSYAFWHHVFANGMHFVIAYMYAVYGLNLVLRFITPLDFDDLCAAHEEANGGTILPSSEGKPADITLERMRKVENVYEFRPFMRQMNEFTFWLAAVRASHAALICSRFEFLDVPVFWPLLVIYFIMLFATTMRQQLENMIKYKYVPFSFGKKSYGSITRPNK